jgi:glutamate racemase
MIGLFDSGTGGLTILEAVQKALPGEPLLFLGDHARAPYGNMSNAEIVEATREGTERLFAAGCGLVVLACNTASAVALRSLQEDWLPIHHTEGRILGVLVPMVEALTGLPWERDNPGLSDRPGQTVAVFATTCTVRSRAYLEEIEKRAPSYRIVQQACPGLVRLIEAGAAGEEVQALVDRFVGELMVREGLEAVDGVILGCTHYPLIEACFRAALPAGTKIVSQPRIVAYALKDYMERHVEFRAPEGAVPAVRLLTTGDPRKVSALARRLLGREHEFEAA